MFHKDFFGGSETKMKKKMKKQKMKREGMMGKAVRGLRGRQNRIDQALNQAMSGAPQKMPTKRVHVPQK